MAVVECGARTPAGTQVIVQIGLLLRQAELQPFGEHLMMAIAQCPIGGLRPENPQKFFVTVSAGGRVPQRCQEGQAPKNGWYLRERFAPEHGCGRPH